MPTGSTWGEWASFQMPTSVNPYIDPDEIEAALAHERAALEHRQGLDLGQSLLDPWDQVVAGHAEEVGGIGDDGLLIAQAVDRQRLSAAFRQG